MKYRIPLLARIASCLLFAAPAALTAQELKVQPTPFTVWLDFQTLSSSSAPRVALPLWLESVQPSNTKAADGSIATTTFRLRFRHLSAINNELLLRLFFDDTKGCSPTVTAWNEIGTELFQSQPLGDGLGLPTSNTLVIPMTGIDYLDIDVAGSGANLRGAFLSSVKESKTKEAFDFQSDPGLNDPFHNAPPTQPDSNDSYLFGRVKATLDANPIKLTPGTEPSGAVFEFDLDQQPLMALVTFEILNADMAYPPEIIVNNQDLGPAAILLPDLADPAYQGTVYSLEQNMHFRYTGWLKCQKMVPGSVLAASTNTVTVQAPKYSNPVAIRSVEVQLKFNWRNLDYTLSPLQQ